jgi:hypothetical protein
MLCRDGLCCHRSCFVSSCLKQKWYSRPKVGQLRCSRRGAAHTWPTFRLASTLQSTIILPLNICASLTASQRPPEICRGPQDRLYSLSRKYVRIYIILFSLSSSNKSNQLFSGTLAEWLTRWPASCSSEQKLASSFGSVCSNHTGVAIYLDLSFCPCNVIRDELKDHHGFLPSQISPIISLCMQHSLFAHIDKRSE